MAAGFPHPLRLGNRHDPNHRTFQMPDPVTRGSEREGSALIDEQSNTESAGLVEGLLDAKGDQERQSIGSMLLKTLYGSSDLAGLEGLLLSQRPEIVRVAVWIASELGTRCAPLLDDIVPLLQHEHRAVRYFAIDCIQSAGGERGDVVAAAIQCLRDDDPAVQAKAGNLLVRSSRETIERALEAFEGTWPADELTLLLGSMLEAESSGNILPWPVTDELARRLTLVSWVRAGPKSLEARRRIEAGSDPALGRFLASVSR